NKLRWAEPSCILGVTGKEIERHKTVPTPPVAHCILKNLRSEHVRRGEPKRFARWVNRQRISRPAGTCRLSEVAQPPKALAVRWLRKILLLLGTVEVRDKQTPVLQIDALSPIAGRHGIRVNPGWHAHSPGD